MIALLLSFSLAQDVDRVLYVPAEGDPLKVLESKLPVGGPPTAARVGDKWTLGGPGAGLVLAWDGEVLCSEWDRLLRMANWDTVCPEDPRTLAEMIRDNAGELGGGSVRATDASGAEIAL